MDADRPCAEGALPAPRPAQHAVVGARLVACPAARTLSASGAVCFVHAQFCFFSVSERVWLGCGSNGWAAGHSVCIAQQHRRTNTHISYCRPSQAQGLGCLPALNACLNSTTHPSLSDTSIVYCVHLPRGSKLPRACLCEIRLTSTVWILQEVTEKRSLSFLLDTA